MKKLIKKLLLKIPYFRNMEKELGEYKTYAKPGHFLSPVPDINEIRQNREEIFSKDKELWGIDLQLEEQVLGLKQLSSFYKQLPFTKEKTDGWRYYYNNPMFSYPDAIFLFCMMNQYKPGRIIEIGSGFSSALMLDTNDHFLGRKTKLEFIEPYPERLYSLLTEKDRQEYKVHVNPVQQIPLDFFNVLNEGDFLFIDSSHVVKTAADINYEIFEILPRLKKGVIVHFHDIFYPFEYPENWVMEGRAWNEDYFLRAFLMYNKIFKIKLFVNHLQYVRQEWLSQNMPESLMGKGGSIWLQKTE